MKSVINIHPIRGAFCGEHYIVLDNRSIGEIRQTKSGLKIFFFLGAELKSLEWKFVTDSIIKFEKLLEKETKKDEEGYSRKIKYYSKEIE